MRIAVTGAGGFLGSALAAALATGHEVVALGRSTDILDEDAVAAALDGAEVVYHLAAVAGEGKCLADPVRAATVDLDGTRSVVRAARRAHARRLVFASTFWVYSVFAARPMPLREDEPLRTDTFYGSLKAAGEDLAASFGDAISLRFSNVYGAGVAGRAQWEGFVGRSVRAAAEGRPITLFGDGSQGLELLHVSDAVRAFARIGLSPAPRERVYNVGVGAPVALREVAENIARAVERAGRPRPPIVTAPAPEGKVWPDRWVDPSRARAEFGLTAGTPLEAGIQEMVKMCL